MVDFWGKSGIIMAILPYTWLSGSAELMGDTVEREVSGFGNPTFRMPVNLYGVPALTLKEFKDYQQNLIVGVSLRVNAPWGQYDPSRAVNISTNRWPHDRRRRGEGRPSAEPACGRPASVSHRPTQFGQDLRQQRRVVPHRQWLRFAGRRLQYRWGGGL
ncbi:transporter [Nitrococcus mobilis]|uniref:Uncharacterized protein n=1 Tax=Nitrococcus mobilis Nb-231 TaxID=314278 RepID=A4BTC0_9GAMM|nr:transporter [Nitrococcus mobilis]EAR21022.1 hypothetical protein NB231_07627 [Nitrococcus mobilis Nb-231]